MRHPREIFTRAQRREYLLEHPAIATIALVWMLGAAGFFLAPALLDSSRVGELVSTPLAIAWAIFLTIGAGGTVAGVLTRRRDLEAGALMLLAAALVVHVIAAVLGGGESAYTGTLAAGATAAGAVVRSLVLTSHPGGGADSWT